MPESQANPKIFTLEEANAALPEVRRLLGVLRQGVTQHLAQEARADVLELLSSNEPGADHTAFEQELQLLEQRKTELQCTFAAFERLGCLLKDLDSGLIDFYTWMDGELVLLCWREGEEQVRHWHAVDEGFDGRQSIPGT